MQGQHGRLRGELSESPQQTRRDPVESFSATDSRDLKQQACLLAQSVKGALRQRDGVLAQLWFVCSVHQDYFKAA